MRLHIFREAASFLRHEDVWPGKLRDDDEL